MVSVMVRSSCWRTCTPRRAHCVASLASSSGGSARRYAATTRSTWAVVPASAIATRLASFAGSAMRVMARTFEYDRRPRRICSETNGSATSPLATRSFSRAVRSSRPSCQVIQLTQEWHSHCCQPSRLSNSARSANQRNSAAARLADQVHSSASNRSSGSSAGSSSWAVEGVDGREVVAITRRCAEGVTWFRGRPQPVQLNRQAVQLNRLELSGGVGQISLGGAAGPRSLRGWRRGASSSRSIRPAWRRVCLVHVRPERRGRRSVTL